MIGYRVARHDLRDLAAVLVNEVGRRLAGSQNEFQETAPPALGADLAAADEIAFRDDADQFSGRIDHGKPADVPLQHDAGGLGDGSVRQDGNDGPGHDLMRAHGSLRGSRSLTRA